MCISPKHGCLLTRTWDRGAHSKHEASLIQAVCRSPHGLRLGQVELLQNKIPESVKGVVHSQIFVRKARSRGIGEGAKGFDEFFAAGVDFYAAGAGGVHQTGVDGGDFVADFPGRAGRLNGEAAAAENCVVGDADAAGFARSARGVGAGDDAAVYAVAVSDFFGEVPGGCAARESDFVEDVEGVFVFDGADSAHWVHVEVHA